MRAVARCWGARHSRAFAAARDQAQVVVVGGGILGCSTAYHLAKRGIDVLLLEQADLTAGTTWHAAGLVVTFGSTSATSTSLRKYTRSLYASLEAETGVPTGFKPCGFIELAANADRVEEFRRVASINRYHGVDVEEVSVAEMRKLFPLADLADVEAAGGCGFYTAGDGRVNPVDACRSIAAGARAAGARISTGRRATAFRTSPGRAEMSSAASACLYD
jgi:4-methylaminobutanoate oxidase (formaldehyde-forming)